MMSFVVNAAGAVPDGAPICGGSPALAVTVGNESLDDPDVAAEVDPADDEESDDVI